MKECELCGTELPDEARFCSTCGNHFNLDRASRPIVIEAPLWGSVRIVLSSSGTTGNLLDEARNVWNSLEQEGQLRLFRGQAAKAFSTESVLYCPIYSFADLVRAFKGRWSEISFTFTPISSDELDRIIGSLEKRTSDN